MSTHIVYTVLRRRDGTTYRVRLGRLSDQGDGCLSGTLNSLPRNGRVLIVPDPAAADRVLTPIAPVEDTGDDVIDYRGCDGFEE